VNIRFDNQVVLITGASTGIGAALAKAFGAAGANVVVHYNSSEEAATAVAREIEASGGKALLAQADVTNLAQLETVVTKTLEQWERVDILINNAGSLIQRQSVAEMPEEVYRQIIDLNLTSVFHACKLVVPVMQRQGHGNIINLTSIAARTGGAGGSVLYATSKGAVSTFTRGLAKEVVGDNIRVNAIAPGVILTPFHERYTKPEQMQALVATIPMGRAGAAEECVGAAFFLASDAMSSYITGQIIEVNGGQFMP
jgi:3-oxoacyl-[acyl-carrier protein] reductase